jgi:hypothetical protein
MKAESARWGDAQSISNLPAGHPPRYLVSDWEAAIATVTNTIMPSRSNTVLAQIRADGLYPSLAAPTFTDSAGSPRYGGAVPAGFELRINASVGTIYYTVNGDDPRAPGGTIAPSALTATSPVSLALNSIIKVRARVFNSSNSMWSAQTEADFLVGELGSAANLVISKVHYNPSGNSDAQEFVEIMNIGSTSVDLTNCRFTAGIEFTFPAGYILGAGARCLVVRDLAAFQLMYPAVPVGSIAGVFANDTVLKNEGEELKLVAADGATIRQFAYQVSAPWPAGANGAGACLVLIKPLSNPDHQLDSNWRASVAVGGSPGVSDASIFSQWATANEISDPSGNGDEDKDGLTDFVEYVLGTDPHVLNRDAMTQDVRSVQIDGSAADYFTLTFTSKVGRDDAAVGVQAATNVNGPWVDAVPVGEAIYSSDGTEIKTFRHPRTMASDPRQFLRIKATRPQ